MKNVCLISRRRIIALFSVSAGLVIAGCTSKKGAPVNFVKGQRDRLIALKNSEKLRVDDSLSRLKNLSKIFEENRLPDGSTILTANQITQVNQELSVINKRAAFLRKSLEKLYNELKPYIEQSSTSNTPVQ